MPTSTTTDDKTLASTMASQQPDSPSELDSDAFAGQGIHEMTSQRPVSSLDLKSEDTVDPDTMKQSLSQDISHPTLLRQEISSQIDKLFLDIVTNESTMAHFFARHGALEKILYEPANKALTTMTRCLNDHLAEMKKNVIDYQVAATASEEQGPAFGKEHLLIVAV
ncbi:hypothetical protein BGZ47_001214 [Haplosporangium gracile]|nr:hypothetical protein BGZ47_001214 [Haplosporangium gracile]